MFYTQSAVRGPQSAVRSPQSIFYTDRSKNVISVSDISAVNFIVEWKLFAFSTKLSILSRLVYIDDVFSPRNSLDKKILDKIESFVEKANNFHSTIKFTAEMSETEITFLDTTVYKGVRFDKESILDVQTNYKPTEVFKTAR